jgi:hypothetical protein
MRTAHQLVWKEQNKWTASNKSVHLYPRYFVRQTEAETQVLTNPFAGKEEKSMMISSGNKEIN